MSDDNTTNEWYADRSTLEELLSTYTYIVDSKRWNLLSRVFTEDAVYDATSLDVDLMVGLDSIVASFGSRRHPVAHLAFSPIVRFGGSSAKLWSKWLTVLNDRTVVPGTYTDHSVGCSDGNWRISSREAHRTDKQATGQEMPFAAWWSS